jgi:hypothetical protein
VILLSTSPAPTSVAAVLERWLTRELRLTLALFAGLALIAGVLLFVLAEHTDAWFSWTIEPPLTAAFLGAAYWAAFVLIAWSATRERWSEVRATIPPVLVIAVLLLVATLIHLDKFDLDSVFGWFWLVVYALVPPVLVVLVAVQLRQPGQEGRVGRPLPWAARAPLAAHGAVLLGLGAALFIAPTDADGLWPWALTPLTARAVGAFLCGFGVAALHAAAEGDASRFRGAALAYLALGLLELLAGAIFAADFGDDPFPTAAYVAFLTGVCVMGAWGVTLTRALERPEPVLGVVVGVDAHAASFTHGPDVRVARVHRGAAAAPPRPQPQQ